MQEETQKSEQADEAAFIAGKAVMHATIQITRAATGKVEEYQIVGTPMKDED